MLAQLVQSACLTGMRSLVRFQYIPHLENQQVTILIVVSWFFHLIHDLSAYSGIFICSFSAIKTNAGYRNRYERVVEKGKPMKMALIAVCNKQIKQAFAITRSGEKYNPEYNIAA